MKDELVERGVLCGFQRTRLPTHELIQRVLQASDASPSAIVGRADLQYRFPPIPPIDRTVKDFEQFLRLDAVI